jgi:hypothetical protein
MMKVSRGIGAISLVGVMIWSAPDAKALCIYGGKHFTKSTQTEGQGRLYATTTLADEFTDSVLVIHGSVLSRQDIGLDHQDTRGWGTVYRVGVDEVFKGHAPNKSILYYSDRDSGGFYLGEGGESREYLLFLDPIRHGHWASKEAPGAYEVNYNCGQSRQWREVSPEDRKRLSDWAIQKKSN